jgi:hypothetical protein
VDWEAPTAEALDELADSEAVGVGG